jgi:hypothetical protein
MEFLHKYDKNEKNIIDQDDLWYYADKKFVTNSHLGQIIKGGPQTLKAYYERGQEDTATFAFGRAAHCLMLEKDAFNGRYYSIDDAEICAEASGKDWKKMGKSPRSTKIYKTWLSKIKSENAHRELLSIEEYSAINNMVDKAMSYPLIREMVEAASGREVIYHKEMEGVNCKIKVDAINPSNFILDYKTSAEAATINNFRKSVKGYSYDRQGAFYSDVAGVKSFFFLVQEKTYPYTVCLVELSPPSKDEGRIKYQNGLRLYKTHFLDNPRSIDQYLETGSI